MKWRTLGLAAGFVVIVAQPTLAQNPNATPSSQIGWDQDAPDMATAQGYTYQYLLDAAAPVVLPGHKCGTGPAPTTFSCAAPFPAITPGPHSLTLTASNIAGASLPSTPLSFVFVLIPSPPKNLRIVTS